MTNKHRNTLFRFAVIADTHITEKDAPAIDGYDQETVQLSVKRLAHIVRKLKRLSPDFVIHLGDITHPRPDHPAYTESAKAFYEVFRDVGCPFYLVAGNHDIGQKHYSGVPIHPGMSQGFVNNKMIAAYEEQFQKHFFSFEHEGCLFVVINGMVLNSGLDCEKEQREWLETLLATNSGKRIFLFSHYPLYLSEADEDVNFDNTDLPGRKWLLDLFSRYKVEAFFSGHVHNFFFNNFDETSLYVLPSTCFLRHDYHELFRAAPIDLKQGRHDIAKLGFALVDINKVGHLTHIVRSKGQTSESFENKILLPPAHGLSPAYGALGISLHQPWCEKANITTPWGLDYFSAKYIRNDYPLLALWEMGIGELRIPLDDLMKKDTSRRVRELAARGHRFTVYSYGLPKNEGRNVLNEFGVILNAWELIMPTCCVGDLMSEIEKLVSKVPIFFNSYRQHRETLSLSHGFSVDEFNLVNELMALDGAKEVFSGVVFGVGPKECPIRALSEIQKYSANLNIRTAAHVQFARRQPLNSKKLEESCHKRIVEATIGSLGHTKVSVFVDNFIGIDRGYFFCEGLVDRLYNPQTGAGIIKTLHSALPKGCRIGEEFIEGNTRLIQFHEPDGVVILSTTGTYPLEIPAKVLPLKRGMWIDLSTGHKAGSLLLGPTLIVE